MKRANPRRGAARAGGRVPDACAEALALFTYCLRASWVSTWLWPDNCNRNSHSQFSLLCVFFQSYKTGEESPTSPSPLRGVCARWAPTAPWRPRREAQAGCSAGGGGVGVGGVGERRMGRPRGASAPRPSSEAVGTTGWHT